VALDDPAKAWREPDEGIREVRGEPRRWGERIAGLARW